MDKQCYMLFRVDRFCRGLANSRFKLIQAFGGMGINLVMSYCYVTVLTIGAEYERKTKKKKGVKR